MKEQWSKKQIWEWYDSIPWIRGCNFMSSDCANRIDQWQKYGFEERLVTTDRELELAAKTGFNAIRVIVDYYVWKDEHDTFFDRFERYVQTAAKHGISLMVCFGNDCSVPKCDYQRPVMGKQSNDWGYHGGRKKSPHGSHSGGMGWSLLDEASTRNEFYFMMCEIIGKYAHDKRILIWDIFNEPGHSGRGDVTGPYLKEMFRLARELDPDQPLTSGIFCSLDALSAAEKCALELSDIVSYHNYNDFNSNIREIDILRELGRPLLNSEWLNRLGHNTIAEMFPLFYLEKVACFNWGFVAGLYQTYEPWEGVWKMEAEGKADHIDFTKWLHDLFRPSLRPYDPKEIKVIREYCTLADEKWRKKNAE